MQITANTVGTTQCVHCNHEGYSPSSSVVKVVYLLYLMPSWLTRDYYNGTEHFQTSLNYIHTGNCNYDYYYYHKQF